MLSVVTSNFNYKEPIDMSSDLTIDLIEHDMGHLARIEYVSDQNQLKLISVIAIPVFLFLSL